MSGSGEWQGNLKGRRIAGAQREPQGAALSQEVGGYPRLRVVGTWILDAGEGRDPLGRRACFCPPKVRSQSLPASVLLGLSASGLEGAFFSVVLLGQVWFPPFPLKATKMKLNFFKSSFTWKPSYK